MLPFIFRPYFIEKKNILRLGPKNDGGYIVHKKILNRATLIITCGLNDDWCFEKDLLKKNSACRVIAFDHTVNAKFWLSYSWNNFIGLLMFKKLRVKKILDVFKYIDYKIFFSGKNRHLIKKIGVKNNLKEISINTIFKNIKNSEKVILKIDIEGDEYRALDDINKNSHLLEHLIIEFHKVKKNMSEIKSFIKKNKFLKLIHIHANNYSAVKQSVPDCLEMTFANKSIYCKKNKQNKYSYPIEGIDFPNLKRREDIKLSFYDR